MASSCPYHAAYNFVASSFVGSKVLEGFALARGCFRHGVAEPIGRFFASASKSSGLHVSQVSFLAGIFLNVPLAAATRFVPKGKARHAYGALTTLSLLALAYGRDVQQFVWAGAFVYGLMRMFPTRCGHLAWGTVFTYQIYLHYKLGTEEAWNAGAIDFTGSFMMFTLKLISIAMDYQDGHRHIHFGEKRTAHSFRELPAPLEYSGYLFGLGGILVGPHFYYDEYMRYAHNEGEYKTLNTKDSPRVVGAAAKAFMSTFFFIAVYLQLGKVITDRPAILKRVDPNIRAWEKLLIGFVANLEYRVKLYFTWHLEETALILSGFGFSGWSKEDKETPVWTKAVSAAVIECEAPPSFAVAVVKWNRHTGKWLRNYVYTRIPGGGLPALMVTQVIAGIWHGLSPSFVLFFSHSALLIYCSRILYRIQMSYLPKETLPYTNFGHSLLTLFMLNYIAG